MKCTKCGNELQENQKFCTVCGTKTEIRCPKCNEKLQLNQKFCTACGYKIENVSNQPKQEDPIIFMSRSESGNHRKKLLIGGGIICFFILLIGFFIITHYNKESEVIISQIETYESIWGNTTVTLTVDNLSDSTIKDIEIAFMAWDENQLPVIVSEEFDYYSDTYCMEGVSNAINLLPKGSETVSIDVVSSMEQIHYILPFIISYTTYDGSEWKNSRANFMRKKAGSEIKNLDDVFVLESSPSINEESIDDINGSSELEENFNDRSYEKWIGEYVDEDGQMISINSADEQGVELMFTGYSEEGWNTDTQQLPYKNSEKTQVSSAIYSGGTLIEETIYTLTGTGIAVIVEPSGGWKEGIYIRQ